MSTHKEQNAMKQIANSILNGDFFTTDIPNISYNVSDMVNLLVEMVDIKEDKLFINLSNHPVSAWEQKQVEAAQKLGHIVEIKFPNIPTSVDDDDVWCFAEEMWDFISTLATRHKHIYVMAQGEFFFVESLHRCFVQEDLSCYNRTGYSLNVSFVVAASERNTVINEDGSKTVRFSFVKFRR